MKNSHSLLFIIAILFYGCANNTKLTSSFGERKYNKGHFWNIPATIPIVATMPQTTAEPKTIVTTNIKKEITSTISTNNETVTPATLKAKLISKLPSISKAVATTTKTIKAAEKVFSPTYDPHANDPKHKGSLGYTILGVLIIALGIFTIIAAFITGTAALGGSIATVVYIGLFGLIILICGAMVLIRNLTFS